MNKLKYGKHSIICSMVAIVMSCGCIGIGLALAILALMLAIRAKDEYGNRDLTGKLAMIIAIAAIVMNAVVMMEVLVSLIVNRDIIIDELKDAIRETSP